MAFIRPANHSLFNTKENRSLAVYFIILFALCATVIVGVRMLEQEGEYFCDCIAHITLNNAAMSLSYHY